MSSNRSAAPWSVEVPHGQEHRSGIRIPAGRQKLDQVPHILHGKRGRHGRHDRSRGRFPPPNGFAGNGDGGAVRQGQNHLVSIFPGDSTEEGLIRVENQSGGGVSIGEHSAGNEYGLEELLARGPRADMRQIGANGPPLRFIRRMADHTHPPTIEQRSSPLRVAPPQRALVSAHGVKSLRCLCGVGRHLSNPLFDQRRTFFIYPASAYGRHHDTRVKRPDSMQEKRI